MTGEQYVANQMARLRIMQAEADDEGDRQALSFAVANLAHVERVPTVGELRASRMRPCPGLPECSERAPHDHCPGLRALFQTGTPT